MAADAVIEVTVVVFPDGSTMHAEGFLGGHALQALRDAWWDQVANRDNTQTNRQRYADWSITGGVVFVRMLRSDYQDIPATNQSAALTAAAGL